MKASTAVERMLRRERLIVLSALGVLLLLAWIYVLLGAGTGMSPRHMTTFAFPPYAQHGMAPFGHMSWSPAYAVLMFLMWAVMMIAMMLPSAVPMVLLHARVARNSGAVATPRSPLTDTGAFLGGYVVVWLAFSLAAVGLQWSLEAAGLVTPMLMWSNNALVTGTLLILAGVYQFSPLKRACLSGCRSPAEFLASHWKRGAFQMGIIHGAVCVGCCWALMLLLFAGGVMNLVWIAGLTALVLIEKIAPGGVLAGRLAALVLILTGIAVISSWFV